jgi:hypothetical protein
MNKLSEGRVYLATPEVAQCFSDQAGLADCGVCTALVTLMLN